MESLMISILLYPDCMPISSEDVKKLLLDFSHDVNLLQDF